MTITQTQCFVELHGFPDLARYVCALRDYPLRTYSHNYGRIRVISSTMELSSTLLTFYVPMEDKGRYVSYHNKAGREHCAVVDSTKKISIYSPIISYESKMSPLKTRSKSAADRFHPVKVSDLGSLARLTYDPESPDGGEFALFAFEHEKSWVIGHVTLLGMDDTIYQFNYTKLESEPIKPFVKYRGNKGRDPEFTDTFPHGFSYLPVIKIKEDHPIFGL